MHAGCRLLISTLVSGYRSRRAASLRADSNSARALRPNPRGQRDPCSAWSTGVQRPRSDARVLLDRDIGPLQRPFAAALPLGIRSEGGTSTETPGAASDLLPFSVILFQPRSDSWGTPRGQLPPSKAV